MNAQRLLGQYERIADAPDAIARLRHFILDLAVRGKLVPQDANDEPASELLKRIAADKAELVKTGDIRHQESGPDSAHAAFPVIPPAGWAITRLATISRRIHYGYTASADDALKDVRMLRITDIQENAVDWFSVPGCLIEADEVDRYKLDKGDVLIARTGGTIGKTFLVRDVPVTTVFASYLIRIQGTRHVFDEYLKLFLESPLYWTQLREGARGTGQPNVNGQTLGNLILSLPPFAEQHRVVAKVDELMGLCDRLEAARMAREAVRDRLAAASLARLNAPDPNTFQDDTRFALDTLAAITTRPDQIEQLRQTILSLAVVGKLTDNRLDGAHALEDLRIVEANKRALALKKPKAIAAISLEEQWCALPERWNWARWDQITDWITYGFTRPMPHEKDGIPIVTGKNVNGGKIIFETAHRTPTEAYRELNDKDRPRRGDILVTKDGSIGRTAIVEDDEPFCINQSVAVLWLRSCHFNRRYLQLAIDCPQTQQALLAKTEGVAIKHISIIDLGKMVFPVPPLAEQHRIVAKVDELMALCDRLEASLTTADDTRRRLLDALLHEALAPVDDREMEAAE
jgi:type I restriction enzyme, S subunit